MNKLICCMCKKEIKGLGHNPSPINDDGRCCDVCNNIVVEQRINDIMEIREGKK